MKEFMQILFRFLPPYKKYMVLTVVFNILSAVLNVFSFMAVIPILQILFKTEENAQKLEYMEWGSAGFDKVAVNNAYYCVQQLVETVGSTTTLLVIGMFLIFMTFLKTGAYFLSSATIVPIRTGVVRDIRNMLYKKITSLPLGYFT
ncbi:MAG: ABC transporter ATP-binding protein, partial [Prevotella sp.]|nr:ABC transporter ATP-binding protein [Prevotella sp.]